MPERIMNEEEISGFILPDDLPPDHRSGFVAVVGKPNVGKSTLMNAYLGQKVAIVSEKPQTTRNRLLGILTLELDRGDIADAQLVFEDTPGIHRPQHKLGRYMVDTAVRSIPDADVVLFVVDVSRPPNDEDRQIAGILHEQCRVPVVMALNKADLLSKEESSEAASDTKARIQVYRDLVDHDHWQLTSALRRKGLDPLLHAVIGRLPLGPRYFPEEQVTDQQIRFMVAELVREQVLRQLRQEVPHSVAVIVEDFKERSESMTYISANVFVERDTQKAIILGHRGAKIKEIGKGARQQIEELLGTRVYLELWVKVKKKWRKDENELRRMGYSVS